MTRRVKMFEETESLFFASVVSVALGQTNTNCMFANAIDDFLNRCIFLAFSVFFFTRTWSCVENPYCH